MNKSGITRRIDELGRIVVPKEIRSNLGIRDGEPLEIFTNDNAIIIKKYSHVENIKDISSRICNIMSDVCGINILITDREKIIAASQNYINKVNKELDKDLKLLIDNREKYYGKLAEKYLDEQAIFTIAPVITNTDCIGLVIIASEKYNEENIKYIKIVQRILQEKLDIA